MSRISAFSRRTAAFVPGTGLLCALLTLPASAQAQQNPPAQRKPAPDRFWKQVDAAQLLHANQVNSLTSRLASYHACQVSGNILLAALAQAPREFTVDVRQSPLIISLPMPEGTFARFTVVESPIVSAQIAAAHPEFKTYLGQGIDDPSAVVRFDHTPDGFHAMILSSGGQVFINPSMRGDTAQYVSYFKSDLVPAQAGIPGDFHCEVQGSNIIPPAAQNALGVVPFLSVGTVLRTYRLALSCDAQYAAKFGGTTAGAMSAMITSMNRVDGVYETEAAIRMTIVKFNIYTSTTGQPFTDSNASSLLRQNETVCDGVNTANTGPGAAGYDIGHVFTTGGGGLAALGVVGRNGQKARGETGSSSPSGDGYDIDYVAHEMGHQFGANHTFNGTSLNCGGGNRNASTAYEPGSGSTIMAYAGICAPEDLQPHSDPYFHTKSFDEIVTYTGSGNGDTSAVHTDTGNHAPIVDPGANYTIPQGTPFVLTAAATDADNDPITYDWEEFDLGSATPPTNTGAGVPLFRSLNPTSSPSRIFPNFTSLLANAAAPWEVLPAANKTLNFRVTVRDNKAGGGGVNYAAMQVTVSGSPFALTNNTAPFSWNAGSPQTVTWTVGGGSIASNVNLLLSTDGGTTFTMLAANVPNSGSAVVTVPATATTKARLMIQAVGNIFFDVSRADSTIVNPTATVSGTLTFDSIDPAAPAQNVTFEFRPAGGTAFSQTVSVPASGVFSLPGIARANYTVRIKSFKYLAKVIAVDLSGGDVTGVTATLPGGDANNDNKINFDDFLVLLGAYESDITITTSGYEANADFNGNGTVNFDDFLLLLNNFDNSGDS